MRSAEFGRSAACVRSFPGRRGLPLPTWGRVLHDDDLAQAIVDRVLERGRLLHLDGPAMRTKHLGLDDPTAPEAPSDQVVRISGIPRSELPEPAHA